MRTGELERVSTAVSTASGAAKPRSFFSSSGSASSSAAQTNGGKQSCRSHQRTAGR